LRHVHTSEQIHKEKYMETEIEKLRKKVMDNLGLSYDDAVNYLMERMYNQMSHRQAMKAIKGDKYNG
jgi:hypothetical protein